MRLQPTPSRRFQFGLQAVLATTLILSLLFGYLRPLGTEAIVRCGLVVAFAGVMGGLVGVLARKNPDTVLWSVISAVFAYLSVVGEDAHHWSSQYVWPLAGAVAGTTVGAVGQGRPGRRAVLGAAAAGAIIGPYILILFGASPDLRYDFFCAVLGGAILGLVAELAGWLEKRTLISRNLLATGFVLAAILGHWIAHWIAPKMIGRF